MADNQILSPSLRAVASPVDRFVTPRMDTSGQGLSQLAQSMAKLNPKLQKLIATQTTRNAESEFAAGQAAGDQLDPGFELEDNREGWRQLIAQTRKNDPEAADRMVGASPHFRRGLVKAKAERVAMALDDHLAMQWEGNAGGVQALDDPQAVQAWLQEQTDKYNEQMGVNGIDPVMLSEVYRPRMMQAQDTLLNKHMGYRAKARVAEYANEYSSGIGMIVAGGGNASSSERDFINRLAGSESGGNSKAHRKNKDGREFTGWLQFGKARLEDYKRETGTSFTMKEFRESEAIQQTVALWHVRDIDKAIDERGYTGMGYSRDGLRAVAHLGGIGGMIDFVEKGRNASDELGTSLKDYYVKFSSSASQIQTRADEAVKNGVSPTQVNKMTVDAIVAQAKSMGNSAMLDVLDQIDTGNGSLGNIAWVKEAKLKAAEEIADEQWETETRERTLEERARDDARREIKTQGFEAVFSDPFGDHSAIRKAAIESGNPALAKEIHDLERQLQGETYNVPSNHEAVIDLQARIYRGAEDDEALLSEIMQKTGVMFPASVGQSLIDDLRISQENDDWLRDPQVRNWIGNMTSQVRDITETKDIMGNLIVSGEAKANEAEQEITEELLLFLEENENATKLQVRKFVREKAREMLKRSEYQSRDPYGDTPVDRTSAEERVDAEPDPWADSAAQYNAATGNNLTADEFREQFGSD